MYPPSLPMPIRPDWMAVSMAVRRPFAGAVFSDISCFSVTKRAEWGNSLITRMPYNRGTPYMIEKEISGFSIESVGTT